MSTSTLKDYIRVELAKECPKLPRGKTVEDAVNLIAEGVRVAGWTSVTAVRFTNRFDYKHKYKYKSVAYIWFLRYRGVKFCGICDTVRSREDFNARYASGDNLSSTCKYCEKSYYEDNKEVLAEKHKAYYEANKEDAAKRHKAWYEANKPACLASGAKYRATKLNATPLWCEVELIKEFYANRPEGYHVDHIVPLQHPLVCGLHCIDNLQYLTAEENLSKSNKFEVA
jgi:hypothetical protein